MLTHVGPKNYRRFMQVMHGCIAEDGLMLVESIGSRFSNTTGEPWFRKHIFPGGVIPSLRQLDRGSAGWFTRLDTLEFGQHYVPTLRCWHANLMTAWPTLGDRYSEATRRTMEYYLLSSAASFRAGRLRYWHLSLAKAGVNSRAGA
jgi:cyclopropane-fatty-acyl-phospholipid synthase